MEVKKKEECQNSRLEVYLFIYEPAVCWRLKSETQRCSNNIFRSFIMNKHWKLCCTDMKQSHSSTAGTAEATHLTQPTWCCVQCANCDLPGISRSTCGSVWTSISTHVNSGNIQLKWQPMPERQQRETMCKLRPNIMDCDRVNDASMQKNNCCWADLKSQTAWQSVAQCVLLDL